MTAEVCSTASLEAGEPTAGSAPAGVAWVCLEQPGAWGAKAFTSSGLDPAIGRAFEDAATAAGVRPQLIRSPGRHPDSGVGRRHVLIAFTRPGSSWLLEGQIEDPKRILDLDLDAVAAGERPDWPELSPVSSPVLLVCTNGRRDVCCATLGRSVAEHVAGTHPGRVWEANHLSGHRFAATAALLPSGHVYGRVLDGSILLEAADRGQLMGPGWRGRSTWTSAAQVAESVIREQQGIWDLDAVVVRPEGSDWAVTAGDQSWLVTVTESTEGLAPPSCGKDPEPVRRFSAVVQ